MNKNNRNNEQIYGRNDMIMLEPNNKIYGSLGLADNYVMKTEEGTRLILSNPKQGKFGDVLTEFNLYGRSEQKQYKGINLFSPNIKREDFAEISIPKGTKVFAITDGTKFTGGNFRFFNADKTENMWFGVEKGTTLAIYESKIDVKYVQNLINEDFDLSKVCLGVVNEPIYEPYVGGKPSPSPDYPQEIKSVGDSGNIEVNVRGKNMLNSAFLNSTFSDDGISAKQNSDGRYTISGTSKVNGIINLWIGGGWNNTMPIFTIPQGNYYSNVLLFYYDGKNRTSKRGAFTLLEPFSVTGVMYAQEYVINEKYNFLIAPQLELGSEATPYEPYQEEQTVALPYTLNAIPVSSGGNYTDQSGQQYVADYVDVERGKVVRKIGKLTITGKENWMLGFENWTTYPHAFRVEELKKDILKGNIMNAKYTWYQKQANLDLNSMNAPYNRCIAVSDARFSSVNEFTNELKKQDSNGTPLTVYYVTDTPQEENLSLEEIAAYKALSTKTPTTIIENNYNTWMKATYKSTESV